MPELWPHKYVGAAGMSSKEISHYRAAGGYMFGEVADGVALGAGHRTTITQVPSQAQFNASFMRSTHAWAVPEYPQPEAAPRDVRPEELPNGPHAPAAGTATRDKLDISDMAPVMHGGWYAEDLEPEGTRAPDVYADAPAAGAYAPA